MPHSPCFNVPVLGFPKWLFQPLQFQGSREGGPIASENGGSTTGINSDRGDGYSYRKLAPSTPKARRMHRMSTLGKEDEESSERDKKQTKIISGSAHLENKWLHIASYRSFFWAVCAALRRLQAIDVGGCWIAKWISNWIFCVQRRLSRRSPPHQDSSRLPVNQSPRPDPFVGQGRQGPGGQRRQSSRGRPPSSLVANPFPWPCCYRFNPPVAAVPPSPPPLLHLPPSDSEVLVDDCSINRHPFLIAPPQKNRLSSRR